MLKKTILILTFVLILSIPYLNRVNAVEYIQGEVLKVLEETEKTVEGIEGKQIIQKLAVKTIDKENIEVNVGGISEFNKQKYEVGDKIILSKVTTQEGTEGYSIVNYDRQNGILVLFFIFIFIALLVATKHTIGSLIGMVYSFAIIFLFLIPSLLKGWDPVFTSILASILIIPGTFLLSHGFNLKTLTAIIGTIISLLITGIFAYIFMNLLKITGNGTEDVMFLRSVLNIDINIAGLLLAGTIIGTLGVLDDVTISQASSVNEIIQLAPDKRIIDIFTRSMKIGKDHISSMINTLVLVYTGASMPLLLLFINSNLPLPYILSLEQVSIEIVRTLVGSIGLVLAVPITTILATVVLKKN